jgi:hypothetical protein
MVAGDEDGAHVRMSCTMRCGIADLSASARTRAAAPRSQVRHAAAVQRNTSTSGLQATSWASHSADAGNLASIVCLPEPPGLPKRAARVGIVTGVSGREREPARRPVPSVARASGVRLGEVGNFSVVLVRRGDAAHALLLEQRFVGGV